MGKHRHRARNDRGDGDRGENNRRPYILMDKKSELFEHYYKGQNLVPEEEWDRFIAALQRPLPCTFRITGFRSHAKILLENLKKDYFNNLLALDQQQENSSVSNNDSEVNQNISQISSETALVSPSDLNKDIAVKSLPWYPDGLAWQLDLERKAIRQDEKLKKLHQFLIQETESGHISRQEAVSMIPPLILDVQINSKVLDMCAAPGSKTGQLIEYLHADESLVNKDGFVIANDNDNKRCYLMVHQLSRLLSPNFAVINMDASNMSNFVHTLPNMEMDILKFDRILCDVPCSGDGTLRKNVDAWHRWNPGSAHGLHNLQRRILKRGIEMLSDDGNIVYSTCSFNPIENEAVVLHILKTMKGTVELVDFKDKLPGLQFENGRNTWKVMTKNREWYDKFDDVPERLHTQIMPSMFPVSQEESKQFNLDRCIRILPHKQDTGGFFVALFHKRPLPNIDVTSRKDDLSEDISNVATINDSTINDSNIDDNVVLNGEDRKRPGEDVFRPVKRTRHFGFKEDPFIFLKTDDAIWKPIIEFYGITEEFPFSQLMVRCETGKKRNIYYVSSIIKSLAQQNEDKFKFINFGVKIFSRSMSKDVHCEFRLVQDGVHILFPYITKRIVSMEKNDVVLLLNNENPFINKFSKHAQSQMKDLDQGGCIFVYEPKIGSDGPNCRLLLCGWKGKVSCRSFLPKCDRGHILRLCGVELHTNFKTGSTSKDSFTNFEEKLGLNDESCLIEELIEANEEVYNVSDECLGHDNGSSFVETTEEAYKENTDVSL